MLTQHCSQGFHEDACPAPLACRCDCHPPIIDPVDPRARTRHAGGHNTDLAAWESEKRAPEVVG